MNQISSNPSHLNLSLQPSYQLNHPQSPQNHPQTNHLQMHPSNISPKSSNLSTQQNLSPPSNQFDKSNPFQALTQFKSTQDQYQILKKRLQVLKLKNHKNNNRYQLNQRKLIIHHSIQKATSLQKEKIQLWKQQNQQIKNQQKIENLKLKLIHHRNIQSIIENLKTDKKKQYDLSKEQSINNQQKIIKMEQQSIAQNKAKFQKIKQIQLFSKASLEAYNKSKIVGFKEKKYKETDSLILRKLKKEEQIKKMMELEMEMIQNQSSSRLILEKSTQKLKEILNPETNLRSSRINKTNKSSEKYVDNSLFTKIGQNSRVSLAQTSSIEKNEKMVGNDSKQDVSTNLTREQSFISKVSKKGFSLPEIKSSRKYP